MMKALPVLNPHAAGVDVGSETLHVSIAGDAPQVFGTFTKDVHALRDWLLAQPVQTVAMEATGVYWLYLYEALEAAGLEVVMVNGKHVQNVPGRKTDMADCQWLATLHAHGLLRGGFVPPTLIRRLQDYQRLRNDHISLAAGHVQHMQKALERMNVKLHDVISSLVGESGLAVVRAILAGERDPEKLVALCDRQIRARKRERVIESLRGQWKDEPLFALAQALRAWEFYQQLMAECDRQIESVLRELAGPPPSEDGPSGPTARSAEAKRLGRNAPQIEALHELVQRICGGREVTALPALTDYTVLQLISEVGTDLSVWHSEKHFTAWLGLAPGSHQSGKRRGRSKRSRNRAGRLFCVVARTLARSVDKGLGGFYRRLRARRGGLVAVQGLARKLAALFYRVMRYGMEYVEHGLKDYEAKVAASEQRLLCKLAARQGFILQPATSNVEVHG